MNRQLPLINKTQVNADGMSLCVEVQFAEMLLRLILYIITGMGKSLLVLRTAEDWLVDDSDLITRVLGQPKHL